MDEIKVTPEELRTLAVKMQESRELTENLKNNVYKATEEIRGGTENSMAHNISSKMRLLNQKIGYLYEYLERNIAVLNKAADEFESADIDLSKVGETISNSSTDSNYNEIDIQQKVQNLKQVDGFRQGDHWGNESYDGYYKGYYINGSGCFVKAKQMQVEIMGSTTSQALGTTNYNDIRPGDVVYYNHKNGPHWVFVTDVKDGKLLIGEGNYGPKDNKIVNYRTIDSSEFQTIHAIYRVQFKK